MNEREMMEYIELHAGRGSVYGLESIRSLCQALGNPQNSLSFLHLAGTNGKGSVLAYLSTILKEAGYCVGRYISPSVYSYREKWQVNGKPVLAREAAAAMTRVKEAADQMEAQGKPYPTVFELETAVAFVLFAEKKCDLVALETGLGGTLDATNVIENTVAEVFVSISRDHMAFLGNTLEEIARNKAGIIKPGSIVISTWQQEKTEAVLRSVAKDNACDLTFASKDRLSKVKYGLLKQSFSYQTAKGENYNKLEISLAGAPQIDNAALAVEVISAISGKYPVSEKALRKGLLATRWPGRFSVLAKNPYLIVDGAHNADAALRLAESVRYYFTNKKIVYIMGMLRDKEYEQVLAETASYAEHILTVTPPDNPRALSAHDLAEAARAYHPMVTEAASLEEAVELAYLLTQKDQVIIAFGSLSYLGRLESIVKKRSEIHGRSGKSKKSH